MKYKLIFAILIVLALPLLSAQINLIQNEVGDVKFPCYFNGTFCSGSATCNVTMTFSEGDLIVNNTLATNQLTFHNVTLNGTQTSKIGDYSAFVSCTDQGFSADSTFSFKISPFGKELSTSQGLIYLGVLLITLTLLGISMYWAVVIPWANTRNLDGEIVHINNLRYLKILLWFISYIFLIWITFLMKSVTENFLFIDVAAKIFNASFWFLIAFLFPIFTLLMIFTVIIFLRNLKLAKLISEGIFPE